MKTPVSDWVAVKFSGASGGNAPLCCMYGVKAFPLKKVVRRASDNPRFAAFGRKLLARKKTFP
jgi:hypothetical protein